MKFINRIISFMSGRYGPDNLYKFLFWLYIITFLINLFVRVDVLTYIEIMIIVIMFYRSFSKKVYKRRRENRIYLNIKNKVLKPFKNIFMNIKDKNNIYKKCNKCKTILKLPVPHKRGLKHVKCPTCGKRLRVFAMKKMKVEIIRKK